MLNKNATKIGVSVLGLSLLFSFPVGALWPFSGSISQENSCCIGTKEAFEDSKDKLELTRNNYKEMVARLNDAVAQFEISLNDFKDSRVYFEDQLGKLDAAYKEWAENDYALKGDSYEKFNAEKEQFDKIFCLVKIKEDILKNLFDNLSEFIQKDSAMYDEYKNNMSSSIDAYYSYGLSVAKGITATI